MATGTFRRRTHESIMLNVPLVGGCPDGRGPAPSAARADSAPVTDPLDALGRRLDETSPLPGIWKDTP